MGNVHDSVLDVRALRDQASGRYPEGRLVTVAGGGEVFVRETEAPFPGAPVLLCYPGWTASGALNFAGLVHEARRHFRMLIIDNPGAGRTKAADPFTINQSAQDGIAVLEALGVERALVLGYSMGGPIASLHALLRPQQVSALALSATSNAFDLGFDVLYPFSVAATLLSKLPRMVLKLPVLPDLHALPFGRALDEFSRDSPRALIEAGAELHRWQSHDWLPKLTMPAAVVVTTLDNVVPPAHQRRMAALLPNSRVYPVRASHVTAPLGVGGWPTVTTRALLELKRQVDANARRAHAARGRSAPQRRPSDAPRRGACGVER